MIVIVGPFPPPLHGASAITIRVTDMLEAAGHDTLRCNMAPAPKKTVLSHHFSRILACAHTLLTCLKAKKGYSLYHSLSGGFGLVYDVLVVMAARLGGAEHIVFHHHSFAYVKARNWLFALILACAGQRQTHITLCHTMASNLKEKYGRSLETIIVSNMAFQRTRDDPLPQPPEKNSMVIGYLSNITLDKGIDCYLDLFELLRAQGSMVKGIIAGPFGNETVRQYVMSRIGSIGNIDYAGPVYGEQKNGFFAQLDIFLFPSRYEAQPVVIYEAQMAGIPVVATGHGCMTEMLVTGRGYILPDPSRESLEQLASQILHYENDQNALASLKEDAVSFRQELKEISAEDRKRLLYLFADIDAKT